MKPRKKGQQWEICYRCPGYTKLITERFPTYEAANLRVAEIEYEKSIGQLRPPVTAPGKNKKPAKRFITVGELMDEYVQIYGLKHWGDSYYSDNHHRIEHYIKPYIGNVLLCDLTTHDLDLYYNSLLEKPAVILKGHKKTDRKVSPSVIAKIHTVLRAALNQAVTWEYIKKNPAEYATLPDYTPGEVAVWSTEDMQTALSCCDDPILSLAMHLAVGCSLRVGEVLGLTWDCVHITDGSIQDGTANIFINKTLKRCGKEALAKLERKQVLFTFPEEKKSESTTSLVLKIPKTKSSIRTIYLPQTVALALLDMKAEQDRLKALCGEAYTDFNLVIAQENGRPYEESKIADKLRELIEKLGLPPVVFHSFRHFSTSAKLHISGGDIKSVQGDTGHAQAKMVTDRYGHFEDKNRQVLARKVEKEFFQQCKAPSGIEAPKDDPALDAYRLLQEKPEMAQMIVALLQAQTSA